MALAESYVLSGALPAAVDQLNLARKAQDVSFYDQAVIDARERELQQRQKDEKQDKKDRGENLAAGQNGVKFKVETGKDAVPNSRLGTAPGFGTDTRSGFESLDAFERRTQRRSQ